MGGLNALSCLQHGMYASRTVHFRHLLAGTWRASLLMGVYSIAVEAYQQWSGERTEFPIAIPAMLGTALSILISFRTNAAYERWWEARQVWGEIVNDSRTLARQVTTLVQPSGDGAEQEEIRCVHADMVHRQIAWNYALAASLRGQDVLAAVDGLLEEDEREALAVRSNKPNAILQTQGAKVRELLWSGRIDTFRFLPLEDTLRRLTDHMGKCERIKNTVFPPYYGYLVSRVVWLFCALLPWGLVDVMSWYAVPVAVLTGVAFLLLEDLGAALADPFEDRPSDTPMTALATTIEINLRQMLGETEVPDRPQPVDDILM